MPKSSMLILTPRALMACRRWAVSTGFSMATVSVISSFRFSGGSPDWRKAWATVLQMLWWASCRAEMFTLMLTEPMSLRSTRVSTMSRQACPSTHSPRGTMKSVASATVKNSTGCIRPWRGWFQRNSASMLVTVLVSRQMMGW